MASQGAGSRSKGSGYERVVAKLLSEWSGEQCYRTPGSGGLGHMRIEKNYSGDITFPVDSSNIFTWEVKKQESMSLKDLFLGGNVVKTFWKQSVEDALRMEEYKLVPALVFSKNRDKNYFMIPYTDKVYNRLDKKYPVMKQSISFENIREEVQWYDVLITTLESVLEEFTAQELFDTYKELDWNKYNRYNK